MLDYLVTLLRDPVKGPKMILSLISLLFFWIALMQGINANLWGETPRFDSPASTYEEYK